MDCHNPYEICKTLNRFLVQRCVYPMLMSVVSRAERVHHHQYTVCIGFVQLLHALLMWDQYIVIKMCVFVDTQYNKVKFACLFCVQKVGLNVIISLFSC